MFLEGMFKLLLPMAVEWAQGQEQIILRDGVALSPAQLEDARKIGVAEPERVRLLAVPVIQLPEEGVLHSAAKAIKLITPDTVGLTFRYGIYLRDDFKDNRNTVCHELVHTMQYERMGGFEPFLQKYLSEITKIGYPAAPMEQEAIKKAAEICG